MHRSHMAKSSHPLPFPGCSARKTPPCRVVHAGSHMAWSSHPRLLPNSRSRPHLAVLCTRAVTWQGRLILSRSLGAPRGRPHLAVLCTRAVTWHGRLILGCSLTVEADPTLPCYARRQSHGGLSYGHIFSCSLGSPRSRQSKQTPPCRWGAERRSPRMVVGSHLLLFPGFSA